MKRFYLKLQYFGVTTNNLKNIDIEITHGQTVMFSGPSGSGKSSIAVDTIHKISEDELFQLLNAREDVSRYTLREFSNILPSVCLQQENYNRNPHSTIATYFSLDIYFKQLFAIKNSVSQRHFQFNTSTSSCPVCNGSGNTFAPDPMLIIEYSSKLNEIPFRCWKASSIELYRQLISLYCEELGISHSKKFNELSEQHQHLFLNGKSDHKYRVEFTSNKRKHRKTGYYKGPIFEMIEELEKGSLPKHKQKYLSSVVCSACKGTRFANQSLVFDLYGKNIGELYLMDFESLHKWIINLKQEWSKKTNESRPFKKILEFLETLIALNLSYLHLNRAIPTLSGGELQRLRLGKAVNSHFTNFLYVLDEPTSGLHPSEWPAIASSISDLKKKKNTIIIIEHNDYLKKITDKVVYLGPGGGLNGGYVITTDNQKIEFAASNYKFYKSTKNLLITNGNSNNIVNLNIKVPLNTIIGVCGLSGSGKSTFLRNILPKFADDAQYFNQSPIRGNAYSIVATASNVFKDFQKLFVEKTKANPEHFVFSSKGKGQCETCFGTGILEDESSYIKDTLVCPTCCGKRFSERTLKLRYDGFNFFEFLSLSIDELISRIPKTYSSLLKTLNLLSFIGLGYLTLFQPTSNLSGGEAQRIKFASSVLKYKTKQLFLLDEPFRGVDKNNILNIIRILYDLVEHGATVLIAEHNPFALSYCSYLLEFGPGSGHSGGKPIFCGSKEEMLKASNSLMVKFLSY